MRLSLLILLVVNLPLSTFAQLTPTQVVRATYRVEHPDTTGTVFLLHRPDPRSPEATQLLLVTAAHAFEEMQGKTTTLILREPSASGDWKRKPHIISIRDGEGPLWTQHPEEDVAILPLELPETITVDSLPVNALATVKEWNQQPPEPGQFIRCIGYPHGSIFKPNPAGFATTRLGCLADYPLTPIEKHSKFLIDFNVFEGDSGGPITMKMPDGQLKIIGLVHGQHFIDERFKNIYSEGLTRKRLGLAIVESSAVILRVVQRIE